MLFVGGGKIPNGNGCCDCKIYFTWMLTLQCLLNGKSDREPKSVKSLRLRPDFLHFSMDIVLENITE